MRKSMDAFCYSAALMVQFDEKIFRSLRGYVSETVLKIIKEDKKDVIPESAFQNSVNDGLLHISSLWSSIMQ